MDINDRGEGEVLTVTSARGITHVNGVTVGELEKRQREEVEKNMQLATAVKKEMPSAISMAQGITRSVYALMSKGVKKVPEEEHSQRIIDCCRCENFETESMRCYLCGCFIKVKASFEAWHCPIGKW